MSEIKYNYTRIIEFKNGQCVSQAILEHEGEHSYYDNIRGIHRGFTQNGYRAIDYMNPIRFLRSDHKKDTYLVLLMSYNCYGEPIFTRRSLAIIPNGYITIDGSWMDNIEPPTVCLKPEPEPEPVSEPDSQERRYTFHPDWTNHTDYSGNIRLPASEAIAVYNEPTQTAASRNNIGETR